MRFSSKTKGGICAFTGATLWGFSGVCSSYLLDNYAITSLQLTMYRLITASCLFAILLFGFYRKQTLALLADKETLKRMPAFGLALFLSQGTYILAIGFSNAGTATVLQSLNIVFIPFVVWVLRKLRPQRREFFGVGLAFIAVFAIATQGDPHSLNMPFLGLVWGLACACSTVFYVVAPGKIFAKWGSFVSTGLGTMEGMLLAILANTAATFLMGPETGSFVFPALDGAGWFAIFGVCVVGSFVSFALFMRGVEVVGPVVTSVLGAMEPLSAAILSAVFLKTAFTGWDWLGLVLMLGTIVIVSMRPKSKTN